MNKRQQIKRFIKEKSRRVRYLKERRPLEPEVVAYIIKRLEKKGIQGWRWRRSFFERETSFGRELRWPLYADFEIAIKEFNDGTIVVYGRAVTRAIAEGVISGDGLSFAEFEEARKYRVPLLSVIIKK